MLPTDDEIDDAVLKLPMWDDDFTAGDLTNRTAEWRSRRLGEIPAKISHVICGESPGGGADAAGKRWAIARGIELISEPITDEDVRRWGRYVGPKMRNRRMAEIGDLALVFWDGKSNGSTDLVTRMVLRGKLVEVIPTRPVRRGRSRRATSPGAGAPRERDEPAAA